jgi:hypothetical protein
MPQVTVWTVYRHPSDFPGRWVLRGHEIFPNAGTLRSHEACFVASTLEEIRAKIPAGTRRVDRAPEDNPVIYECWLAQERAQRVN